MSPEEYILCIFSWINTTCEIIWHLEFSILSGDENIDAEPKVNPKSDNANVHMIQINFGLT